MKEIIIGLISVMASNVLLGASLSKLMEEFSKTKFWSGIFKVLCVIAGILLVYYAGVLNPNIFVININNTDMNLLDALKMVFITAIGYYGYQAITKIIKILRINLIGSEVIHYVEELVEEEDEITISR